MSFLGSYIRYSAARSGYSREVEAGRARKVRKAYIQSFKDAKEDYNLGIKSKSELRAFITNNITRNVKDEEKLQLTYDAIKDAGLNEYIPTDLKPNYEEATKDGIPHPMDATLSIMIHMTYWCAAVFVMGLLMLMPTLMLDFYNINLAFLSGEALNTFNMVKGILSLMSLVVLVAAWKMKPTNVEIQKIFTPLTTNRVSRNHIPAFSK